MALYAIIHGFRRIVIRTSPRLTLQLSVTPSAVACPVACVGSSAGPPAAFTFAAMAAGSASRYVFAWLTQATAGSAVNSAVISVSMIFVQFSMLATTDGLLTLIAANNAGSCP